MLLPYIRPHVKFQLNQTISYARTSTAKFVHSRPRVVTRAKETTEYHEETTETKVKYVGKRVKLQESESKTQK